MSRNSANDGLDNAEILASSFKKHSMSTLNELKKILKASRRTVFRTLKQVGCLSRFRHAGKFYTLQTIPTFDSHGLWFCRGVGFSKYGTLRATIRWMVNSSSAGCTHEELHSIVQLKVHDTLHDLVLSRLIAREEVGSIYVYVNTDSKAAKGQIAKRHATLARAPLAPVTDRTLGLPEVVEILLVVIRKQKASVVQIRDILGAKKIIVSDREIESVLARYGLKKKR